MAFCDADPFRAREAMRRGLVIAQESGNHFCESHLADVLGRLEARHGDPMAALDYLVQAIGNYDGSGNTNVIHILLAELAAFFDRLGRHQAAANVAGFPFNPLTAAWIPEVTAAVAHLREVLGDQTYEAHAQRGAALTTTEMAAYAYDQIDHVRAELEQLR